MDPGFRRDSKRERLQPTRVGRFHENADNLFFAKPVALHLWSLSMGQGLFQTELGQRGNVSIDHLRGRPTVPGADMNGAINGHSSLVQSLA